MKSNVPETDIPCPWGNGLVRVSKTCPWKVGLFLFFFHREIFSLNLIIEHLKVVVNQNENLELNLCLTYLIFVIFFTRAKFLENIIYTEKTRKLRQNTQKIAFFCVWNILPRALTYLIFVIFFTQAKFLEIKNLHRNLYSKSPIYTVNCQFTQ